MKISNLKENPQYRDEVIRLIEDAFEYSDKNSFEIDFLKLINEANSPNCHILLDNEDLVGHIGVLTETLVYKDITMPISLIGGIAIKPTYRGQGLFKDFFNHVNQKYNKTSAISILWSDKEELYLKQGYISFGTTYIYGDEDITAEFIQNLGFKECSLNKVPYNKYSNSYKNFVHILRSQESIDTIKEITSITSYINSDGEYFLINKGHDLKGYIHESSFLSNKVLLSKFKNKKFLSPISLSQEDYIFPMAMGRIENIKLFNQFINKVNKQVSITDGEEIILKIKDEQYKVEKCELLSMIFGPNRVQELDFLDLNIYISGADSI